jgi:alkanesulfonate monooxygenase SsuD/methylene tetrahydromethanopterin reductase-like flavin-dependent oxidoreductase (luciferase family)
MHPLRLDPDSTEFKRTVTYGDGRMPTRAIPERLAQGRNTLNELATEAGRDPKSIEIIAYLVPADRERLTAFEQARTGAAILMLDCEPEDAAMAELERLAQTVFSSHHP